jgi:preprotein translocase subunit SecF
MVVGVVIGTISSIYIASPLLLILGEGRQNSVIEQERSLADEMSTT